MHSQDDQRGLDEWLGNVISCRKDVALSQNHLVAAGTRRGKKALSSRHVAMSYYLQTPTIRLFPDRSWSANSLGSGKNGASKYKREQLCRACRIPLARKLRDTPRSFLEHGPGLQTWRECNVLLTLQCETDLDSGGRTVWEPQCKMAFVVSQVSIWPA